MQYEREKMQIPVEVPDGQSGDWRVSTFTITDNDITSRMMMRPGEYIQPGTYKRLSRGGVTVMSNTPMEVRTNQPIIRRAMGDVLINGLGLGMVLTAILGKDDVRTVTVIEKSYDVIKLVAPTFESDGRVRIIQDDAHTFRFLNGERFSVAWHDIWDNICADNLEDMRKLHRRYGRRVGWQGSWARDQCEYHQRSWRGANYR